MIAGKTWREVRFMTLVYAAILALMMVPAVLVWPDLYADLQRPSAMATAVGGMGDFIKRAMDAMRNRDEDFAYLSYMALQLFFKGTNVAGIAAAVLLGTGLFARERESMTFEFLLSRPVSRSTILWHKVWPCLVAIAVPIFAANALAVPMSERIGFGLPLDRVLWCSLHGALFVVLVFLLTVIASIRCRVQAHAAFWVGGFVIVQLAIYFIPVVRHASIFRLSDFDWYGPMMAGNRGPLQMFDPLRHEGLTTWLVLAAIALYAIAWRQLKKAEL
ncbi:MAG: family transporter protein [Planctomycetota bacterium]|jgi:ABC-type transport system involved in multi-copper enzyme maturation permease subunit